LDHVGICSVALNHRRTQDFYSGGVHMVGSGPGSMGDEVQQKLKQDVKLVCNF